MAKKKAKADVVEGDLADHLVREPVGSAEQTGGPNGPRTVAESVAGGPVVENLIRDRVVRLERMRAGDVRPNPKNFRTHSKGQAETQLAVMKRVGFAGALLAYQPADGGALMLIDGHLRQELTPDDTVPVLVLDVNDDEAAQILASYDPIGAMAGTDRELLAGLMAGPAVGGLLEAAPGLSDALAKLLGKASEPTQGKTDPDDVPDVKPEAITKLGDAWTLGSHRLVCGDARDPAVVNRALLGRKADLLLTDPPYGVAYVGKTADALTVAGDDGDEGEMQVFAAELFGAAMAACRPGAYCYATVPPGPLMLVFAGDWKERGVLRQILVWQKDAMVLGHSEYHYRHEPILFGWLPGPRRQNPDRTRTSVWEFDRPKRSKEHPTMKPVALWERAIVDGSEPGDVVLDPCCGSGTTVIAAERLGRRAAAVEIDPQYCDVIVRRWQEFTGRTATREGKDGGSEE